MDSLYFKWHHSKHDLPKPYVSVTIETKEGRMISGYVTNMLKFFPHRMQDAEGLDKIVAKRWRYNE